MRTIIRICLALWNNNEEQKAKKRVIFRLQTLHCKSTPHLCKIIFADSSLHMACRSNGSTIPFLHALSSAATCCCQSPWYPIHNGRHHCSFLRTLFVSNLTAFTLIGALKCSFIVWKIFTPRITKSTWSLRLQISSIFYHYPIINLLP